MHHSPSFTRRCRALTGAAALAALVTTGGLVSTLAPAAAQGKPAPSLTPQVIAFPSRTFVSVAEPGGALATTTWTHGTSTETSTATAPGVAPDLGLIDINHAGAPCWAPALAPGAPMSPGDKVSVKVAGGAANEQLALTVADVQTVQAHSAPGSTTVVVTGTAKDPATGQQVAAGNLQVRLVAKKQTFTFNGRRDLRADLGGGKDGALSYNTPGSTTDFSFTATFNLSGGKNAGNAGLATADAQRAVTAQTRGIVQNDPVDPTAITIYETPVPGDGTVQGPAAGC